MPPRVWAPANATSSCALNPPRAKWFNTGPRARYVLIGCVVLGGGGVSGCGAERTYRCFQIFG